MSEGNGDTPNEPFLSNLLSEQESQNEALGQWQRESTLIHCVSDTSCAGVHNEAQYQ